jgi:hypothetical protein
MKACVKKIFGQGIEGKKRPDIFYNVFSFRGSVNNFLINIRKSKSSKEYTPYYFFVNIVCSYSVN